MPRRVKCQRRVDAKELRCPSSIPRRARFCARPPWPPRPGPAGAGGGRAVPRGARRALAPAARRAAGRRLHRRLLRARRLRAGPQRSRRRARRSRTARPGGEGRARRRAAARVPALPGSRARTRRLRRRGRGVARGRARLRAQPQHRRRDELSRRRRAGSSRGALVRDRPGAPPRSRRRARRAAQGGGFRGDPRGRCSSPFSPTRSAGTRRGDAEPDDTVLNAARALRYAETDTWASKPAAGVWALARMPDDSVVAAALAARAGGAPVDPDAARAFALGVLPVLEPTRP